MIHWKQLGPVITNDKDAALIADPQGKPVKINGKYVMYFGESGPATCTPGAGGVHGVCVTGLAYSTDLTHWKVSGPVDIKYPTGYNPWELCIGITDYRTTSRGKPRSNILLFTAGTLMSKGRWYYAVSEVAFSRSHLTKETAQLTSLVMQPTTPYEINGLTRNTIFMNTLMFHNNKWWLYYGGGDTTLNLATAPLRK